MLKKILLAATAITAIGLGVTGPASAGPGNDGDPNASAVLPPRDPGMWWIKTGQFSAVSQVTTTAVKVKLWTIPSTINPIYVGALWHFTPVPSTPGAYFVENHNAGCLDIIDGISTSVGAELAVRQCDGTQSQMWFTPYKNGKWAMQNKWSGYYAAAKSPAENRYLTQQFTGSDAEIYFSMPFFGNA